MASVQNMTSGKPGKLIFSFALPLMIGNLFQQFYTVADAMIVGQTLGIGAIAAVGATEWMIWLMLGMIQGFSQGFSIWMAQEFGAGRPKKLRNVILNSVILSAIISVALLVLGQLVAVPVLHILNTPDAVFVDAIVYMRTMFIGIPIVMAYNLFAAVLRSLGDGRTPLYAMIFAAILNIGLDVLFVVVFHSGVAGAAVATVVAQFFSSVFCLVRICKIDFLRIQKGDFSANTQIYLRLLKLGFPTAFQNAVISVGGMIVQSVVNGFGVIFIAGFTATNKLYGMLEVAATSYGFSMITYTGQNIGAGEYERIRKGYRSAMGIAVVTSLVITTVMLLFGKALLGCFISGDEKTVADTLEIAYHYLFIMSVCLPILYYLHVTRSCIQGIGNTALPMVSGIFEFFMRTGCALLFPRLIGQEGIFYAEILAWAGADVVLFFSFAYCMRKYR